MFTALLFAQMVQIPAGVYRPFFKDDGRPVQVKSFWMDQYPVTNEQFQRFIESHPEWRRSKVKRLFAEKSYLKNWQSDRAPGSTVKNIPVTDVSWFAAKAYCQWKHKRLPTVAEWEYVGRASAHATDAENDPNFKRLILHWYEEPTPDVLPPVGSTFKNAYGVYDMHGLVWQWVEDFNSSFTVKAAGCAAGSAGALDKTDYAAFMRFAFRSSLQGNYAIQNLGFRCARDGGEK